MNEFFQNNREKFDTESLSDFHKEAFLDKLNAQRRKEYRYRISSIAAVVVLLILSGVFLRQEIVSTDIEDSSMFCYQNLPEGMSEEIVNADFFYKNRLYALQKECLNQIPVSHFMARIDYISHMGQYYDSRCQLYEKLEQQPDNQALQTALIRQYQMVEQQQNVLVALLSKQNSLN